MSLCVRHQEKGKKHMGVRGRDGYEVEGEKCWLFCRNQLQPKIISSSINQWIICLINCLIDQMHQKVSKVAIRSYLEFSNSLFCPINSPNLNGIKVDFRRNT